MEIRLNRDQLFKSISRVQSIIEKRSNMPILSTVLITSVDNAVHISATDLEISFQQKIPAEILSPGAVTVSGRKLFEILKESKQDTIHIKDKENNWVYITDDCARYNLACLPADEFPVFLEPEDVPSIEIPSDTLQEMISKTIFSVTMDEAGFKLSGVYVERVALEGKSYLRMVSTDGHRLSLVDKAIEGIGDLSLNGGVMIPKKGMSEIYKMAADGEGNVQFGVKTNHCVAKKKDAVVVIRLLESKFPDYNAVIPREPKVGIKIDRSNLLDGMKKMGIMSNESYKGVKVSLENDLMELVSINPDLGDAQENLVIDYKMERLEAGFNARYFIEALQVMDSDSVELGFVDNSSPCLLTGDDDKGFLGLIMPMRL